MNISYSYSSRQNHSFVFLQMIHNRSKQVVASDKENCQKEVFNCIKCISTFNTIKSSFLWIHSSTQTDTVLSFVLFTTDHLDSGVHAEHMLHSKQPQNNTALDNKTQPGAKDSAPPPQIKMLLTAKCFEHPGPALRRIFYFSRGALNPTAFLS